MTKTCIHCGEEFDPKSKYHSRGKINECGDCAGVDVLRYIAQSDASFKSGAGINIFRKPTEISIMKSVIQGENRCGFNANLSFSSIINTDAKSDTI